jgi:hypothetical protein
MDHGPAGIKLDGRGALAGKLRKAQHHITARHPGALADNQPAAKLHRAVFAHRQATHMIAVRQGLPGPIGPSWHPSRDIVLAHGGTTGAA